MKFILRLTKILMLLFLSQTITAQNGIIEEKRLEAIDSLLKSYYVPANTGGAITIIKNGETAYTNSIGLANVEYQIPITNSTLFNIASISKQFTTFLALILEDQGKLSFDDDIKLYLPELKHLSHKISIKQLTNHTHGLPNVDELATLKGTNQLTHHEVVKMLLNIKQANFAPGDDYQYNNTGYVLLTEIIERIGNKPFNEQLNEKIFSVLGMKNTQAVGNYNEVIHNKAYSYQSLNGSYIDNPVQISTMGSSGLYTTIEDMALWAKNYYNTIVGKPEFYERMATTTTIHSGKRIKYGLGLQFDNYKGIDIVFHGGGTNGYRSYILHAPKYQLSLIILANTGDFSGLDIIYNAFEIILKEDIEEEKKYDPNTTTTDLKQFEGTYEIFPGIYYTIIAEEEQLYFQSFGKTEKIPLPILSENIFSVPFIPHSKFIFYPNSFDFQIGDFTYPCVKTVVATLKVNEVYLEGFTGIFRNVEHNITYEIIVRGHQLVARNGSNSEIILNPLENLSFYSDQSYFGKLDFFKNSKGAIKGFSLSGQNLKNIVFEKISQ
ncbi:MAG: beta-lactamase family protein [Chitinophagales bacterium]|nr:beta-lactamase family protein [Chitinophagales bacterium]